MSRILVAGLNYAPENVGVGKYTGELCEWLAARGHQVRVIAAPPYYPAWKVWPGQGRRWYRREQIAGVEVIRCPLWVPLKPRAATRLLHLASFAISSFFALAYSLAWRPQLVISIAPTMASAPAAWAVARLARARCWMHIQDFEVNAAMELGIVDAGALGRVALAAERWMLRRFDRVSTISARMLDRLSNKGVSAASRIFFPNWVDTDTVRPLRVPSPYRVELGIPDDAVVALYSGNMGVKQGLELLSESARAMSEAAVVDEAAALLNTGWVPVGEENHKQLRVASVYFVFGGEGPGRAALEAACTGLPNVRFLPLQPTSRLRDWLGLADIHLLPQRADVADLVMPSKLTGMLASGRTILATALPGTGVAEAVACCGLVTPPGDTSAFVAALGQLCADKGLRERLGHAARRQALATLARGEVLTRFESDLMLLLGSNPFSPNSANASPHSHGHP